MSAILNNILKTQRNSDSTGFLDLFHKINQTSNETFEDPLGLQSALRSCKHLRNQIMFEIPFVTRSLISSPSCYPEEDCGYGFSRDSRILHIVATVTGNVGRCMTHNCFEDADAEYCGLGLGQSDIVGASQYPRLDLLHRVDYLYPHAQDNLCVMVPTADFVHRSVLESFTVSIWCCVLACLLAFSASLKVSWRLSVADAAFTTFTTFVVGSFDARRRLILVWLSLFSVVMLTTFSGSFTSRLAVPKRGADIDTLHQLHAAAHEIFAMRGTSALFAKNLPPEDIVFQLSTKFKEEPSHQSFMLIDLLDLWDDTDRNIFLLHSDEAIDELLRFKLFLSKSDHERSRYRRMRECALAPAYTAFAVRKGWAAARCVDALVQQLLEAGVVAKLKGDEWRAFPSLRTFRGQRLAAVDAFGVRHLYEAFALLACGLAAAAAAFLAERWRMRGRRAE